MLTQSTVSTVLCTLQFQVRRVGYGKLAGHAPPARLKEHPCCDWCDIGIPAGPPGMDATA